MKRNFLTLLAVLFGSLAVGVAPAKAQMTYPFRPPQYGPGYQTQLSPYLNMLRAGDPAANYYIGVLPEQQRRQDRNFAYNQFQGMSLPIPPAPGINEVDLYRPLEDTGHPTAFGYTGSYFGGPAANRAGGTGSAFPQRQGGPPGNAGRWPNNVGSGSMMGQNMGITPPPVRR